MESGQPEVATTSIPKADVFFAKYVVRGPDVMAVISKGDAVGGVSLVLLLFVSSSLSSSPGVDGVVFWELFASLFDG